MAPTGLEVVRMKMVTLFDNIFVVRDHFGIYYCKRQETTSLFKLNAFYTADEFLAPLLLLTVKINVFLGSAVSYLSIHAKNLYLFRIVYIFGLNSDF